MKQLLALLILFSATAIFRLGRTRSRHHLPSSLFLGERAGHERIPTAQAANDGSPLQHARFLLEELGRRR